MSEHPCWSAVNRPSSMPFTKVLSLSWYDGTTAGLAQCSQCSRVFRYDLVDWDSEQERRVFVLSPINPREFRQIIDLLARSESPTWPFWNPRWEFSSSEEKQRVMTEIDKHLDLAEKPEYVVIADRQLKILFATKGLNARALERLPLTFDGLPVANEFNYWKEYLGTQ